LYLFWEDSSVKKDVSKTSVATYQSQYERINKVISILQTLGNWIYLIIFVFLVAISIIIYSIIWNFIYYYKDEIYITRLVWWSRVFIFGPFSMQGVIYSIISFVISVIFFNLFIKNISYVFWDKYNLEFLFNDVWLILSLELLLFIFIWALSWYFSSRKYLK
jgi:cell division protein FtsX